MADQSLFPHHYNTDRKKTFFFWSQEWRREIVPGSTISQNVPSDAERSGNFNDVCPAYTGATFDPTAFPDCPYQSTNPGTPFVNNTLPGTSSTTVPALLSMIPKANNTLGTYGPGQAAGSPLPAYIANPSYPTNWREELIRVDQNFSENERLTVRYIHDSWSTINQGPLWGVYNNTFDNTNTNFVGPTTSFVVRLTSTIKPNLLNEFVGQLHGRPYHPVEHHQRGPAFRGYRSAAVVSQHNSLRRTRSRRISVGNTNGTAYGTGGFAVDTGYFPWKNANPTYTYRDIMTYIHGNHTMFFGGYVAFAQKNQQSTADIQGQLVFDINNPNTTGNPFADLQTGQVSSYAQTSAQPYFYDRYKIFEPFFQDDWRVTRKLTLNLGLRWSFFGRYQEKQFKEFNFSNTNYVPLSGPALYPYNDPNSQLLLPTTNPFNGFIQCGAINQSYPGISMGPTGCMKNKYMNPGPRIGFAYDPFGNGKWAIRGGYGIFFEHMNGNEANAESLQGNPSPLVQNGSVGSQIGYPNVGLGAQRAPSPFSATSIPGQVQWPYMQQWNLNVQHELPSHIVATLAYVGSKGTHLTRQYDLNQLQPVPASQNPYLASGAPITGNDCQLGQRKFRSGSNDRSSHRSYHCERRICDRATSGKSLCCVRESCGELLPPVCRVRQHHPAREHGEFQLQRAASHGAPYDGGSDI